MSKALYKYLGAIPRRSEARAIALGGKLTRGATTTLAPSSPLLHGAQHGSKSHLAPPHVALNAFQRRVSSSEARIDPSVESPSISPVFAELIPKSLPLLQYGFLHAIEGRTAIVDTAGVHSYTSLILRASHLWQLLSNGSCDFHDLKEKRVAFLCPSSFSYVVALWGTWLAGGVAVPLCVSHPLEELEYTVKDCDAEFLVAATPAMIEKLKPLSEKLNIPLIDITFIKIGEIPRKGLDIKPDRAALMLYTSGTTGRPKGVVLTHSNFTTMAQTLVDAWKWSQDDKILQVLPLHHLHGILNALTSCLLSGATCEMMEFNADRVWEKFLGDEKLTVFTAVPTIYAKLVDAYEKFDDLKKRSVKEKMQHFRLMMSGSAALPEPLFRKWEDITGHRLLERFGMTEIGMALSNPYEPVEKRIPGTVGSPLSGISIRIKKSEDEKSDNIGELLVKSKQVFKECDPFLRYYKRADATKDAFENGWFKTGDIVERLDDGTIKILGRSSVDILKSGGYKISALDIERELLSHEGVQEAAVIGVPDETYGQSITAIVVLMKSGKPTEDELREHLSTKLAKYKVPRKFIFVNEIPRNAMGKVNKKELLRWIQK